LYYSNFQNSFIDVHDVGTSNQKRTTKLGLSNVLKHDTYHKFK